MKSFCILGLGRFGQTLALELSRQLFQVMVIDENSDVVNAISDSVTNAVIGNPANESVLRASGIRDYDCAIVCMNENVNDNIFITLTLKDLGVRKIVARAGSLQHKRVLEKIGADMVVFPEQDMGEKLAHMLGKNNVVDYIEFSDDYSIVEVNIPPKWVGKSIRELDIRRRFGVTAISVSRAGEDKKEISPAADRVFGAGDIVALLGTDADIDKITKMI